MWPSMMTKPPYSTEARAPSSRSAIHPPGSATRYTMLRYTPTGAFAVPAGSPSPAWATVAVRKSTRIVRMP